MRRKKEIIYAFIDSQNLNLGIRNDIPGRRGRLLYEGWELDFKKLRTYLTEKYDVEIAYLFLGYVRKNKKLYDHLKQSGFEIIFKPTLKHKSSGKTKTKGNVDTEIVLFVAAKLISQFDKAIIISGDGDFYCLYQFLIEKQKLGKILIPNKNSYSSLLREFAPYIDYISNKRNILEKQKGGH